MKIPKGFKIKKIVIIVLLLSQVYFSQDSTYYKIEKIADGFKFVEGPVWKDGALLFSDIPANTIYKWTPEDSISIFLNPSGNSNGLTTDKDGDLLLAQHSKRRISKISIDGIETILVNKYKGKLLNSPNDMTVHSNGAIFFTDPPYGIKPEQEELGFYGIYKFTPDNKLYLLDTTLIRPNGIALSLDEKKLFVADSKENKIFVWDILNDSTIINKKLLIHMDKEAMGASDGMKMGKDGLIYATGPGGIWIVNTEGEFLKYISIPGQTTNCNWGDDGTTLYVTSGDALYRMTHSN